MNWCKRSRRISAIEISPISPEILIITNISTLILKQKNEFFLAILMVAFHSLLLVTVMTHKVQVTRQ
ncbi:MAG: hypothetical protein ACI9FY_000597 [Patiriisocius sp.]|jgi:hypothetical protein